MGEFHTKSFPGFIRLHPTDFPRNMGRPIWCFDRESNFLIRKGRPRVFCMCLRSDTPEGKAGDQVRSCLTYCYVLKVRNFVKHHRFRVGVVFCALAIILALLSPASAEPFEEYPVDIFRELRLRRYAPDFRQPALKQWNMPGDTSEMRVRGDRWFSGEVRPRDGVREDWLVSVLDYYGNEVQRVRTKSGNFHVYGLYPTGHTLVVHRNSFGSPLGDYYYLGNTFDFHYAAYFRSREYFVITVPPGFHGEDIEISGRLTCNGRPVRSTPLELVFIPVDLNNRRTFRIVGTTDDAGGFCLSTTVDFTQYRVLLTIPGYAPRWWNSRHLYEKPQAFYVGGDLRRDEIRLDSGAVVFGSITRTGRSINRSVEVRCVTTDGLIVARDSLSPDRVNFALEDLARGTYFVVMDEGRTGKTYHPNVPIAGAAASVLLEPGERRRIDLSSSRQTDYRDDYPKALVQGYVRMPGPAYFGTGPVSVEYCDTALVVQTLCEDSRFEIEVMANEPFLIRAGQTWFPWFLDKDLAHTKKLSEGETLSVMIDLQFGGSERRPVYLDAGIGQPEMVWLNVIDGPITEPPWTSRFPPPRWDVGTITATVHSQYETVVFCYTENRELHSIGLLQAPDRLRWGATPILEKMYDIDWPIRLETTGFQKGECRLSDLPVGKYYVGKYEFREETGPIIQWFGAYWDTVYWDGITLPEVPRHAIAVTVEHGKRTIVDFTTPPDIGALQGVLPMESVRADHAFITNRREKSRKARLRPTARSGDVYSCRGRLLSNIEPTGGWKGKAAIGSYLIQNDSDRRIRLPLK